MRGTKAKKIRRMVYGDMAQRDRKYSISKYGFIIADELRFKYQLMKKLSYGRT